MSHFLMEALRYLPHSLLPAVEMMGVNVDVKSTSDWILEQIQEVEPFYKAKSI